jgi:signal transduction histidine kinase
VEHLKAFRTHLATVLIVWHVLVLALSAAIYVALGSVMEAPLPLAIATTCAVIGTIVVGIVLTGPMLAGTEFLARAILHVSSEQSATPAPDIKSIKASQEFFERLASYVYDMSSKSVMAQYPAQEKGDNVAQQPSPPTQDSVRLERLSPLPFFVVGKDKTIKSVSPSALKYLNLSEDKVLGKVFYDVLKLSFSSDDTLDNWLTFSEDKSVTGSRAWDRVKLTLEDLSTKQIDLAAHYSREDTNGNELALILFDHTEKYGHDDAGASFVSMAVHELRTPLTVMRGYIEVFEDELADKLDTEQAEFLRNLSAQAQQLGSFVSNIQNLARIEENALELQLKSENWAEVLNNALNDMEIRAKVRHKELKRKIPDDLPMAAIDRVTMYEVVVNLVENAIKYTHSDEPITVSVQVKDNNWIETTVQDHGIGIPDSLLGHIFDKFYRSHRTSKSVGGTGLGLYISKTIIDAHGGQIWVKTKEGEGSTFGFTIPTFDSVAHQVNSSDNKAIERSAHGWIKNHTLYRR